MISITSKLWLCSNPIWTPWLVLSPFNFIVYRIHSSLLMLAWWPVIRKNEFPSAFRLMLGMGTAGDYDRCISPGWRDNLAHQGQVGCSAVVLTTNWGKRRSPRGVQEANIVLQVQNSTLKCMCYNTMGGTVPAHVENSHINNIQNVSLV